MKKLWLLLLVPVLGLAAVLVYQNLPQKRFARHMVKARLYAKENNYTAAQLEYEDAYNTTGKFTPFVSLEVLQMMNRKSLEERNPAEALANTRRFVKEHPDNKDGLLTLSQLAFQAGDLETAFASVDAILEKDPAHFSARLLLTRIRTLQNRLDLAEEQLRYLYRKYPDSLQALLPLAQNLLKQGKVEESRAFVKQVLADHPKNAAARMLLVDGYLMERKMDSAQGALDAWQAQSDPEWIRPIAVRRATFLALSGHFPEAERVLMPYRQAVEDNAEALMVLALVEAAKGRYDSAALVYSSLGESVPAMRATATRMRIFLHFKTLNPAKALEETMALQIGNHNPDLLPLALAAYTAMGQDNKAAALLQAQPDSLRKALANMVSQWVPDKEFIGQWALVEYYRANHQSYWTLTATQELYRRWPTNPFAINLFASQLTFLHQYAAAARLIEIPAKTAPALRKTLLTLYVEAGERDKAKALAEKLLAEDPSQRGLNAYLADCAWAAGQKDKGIALYEKELTLNPDDAASLNNLAWEFGIMRGDYAKALPYLERLRAQKTQDARIWDTVGWILAKNGKAGEGRRYLREALNLVPDFPSYEYHMGWIEAQAGNRAEALKLIRAAVDSKLPFEERKAAETWLAQQG